MGVGYSWGWLFLGLLVGFFLRLVVLEVGGSWGLVVLGVGCSWGWLFLGLLVLGVG